METIKKDNSGTLSLPENLEKLLTDCTLCPRNCHVNRMAGADRLLPADGDAAGGKEQRCTTGKNRASRGTAGSGAVFFGGCSMRCVFCQNHDIAAGEAGREISVERLKEIFLELQEKGANNINLVTPTHFVPLIVPALRAAKREGLRIPIVYNTSSYEKVSTLQLLDGLVDIYLPDLKYESAALSGCFRMRRIILKQQQRRLQRWSDRSASRFLQRRMGHSFSQRR